MIGQTVSKYKIVEKLGGGGMGVVYKAEDTNLGRFVALKFLPEDIANDRAAVERFKNEARAAAALSHPHICTIHEIDEVDGVPFIAMEYLEGQNLKLAIGGKEMATELVIEFGIQITEALAAAHAKGITHRDIKPSNIFLTHGGQVKVVDFGLAKVAPRVRSMSEDETIVADAPTQTADLTESGSTMGTVTYMSPEQALGQEVDARSDLFSLGAVLYEMITGRQAFAGSTQAAIFDRILNRQPPSPIRLGLEIPYELEQIVFKALEKNKVLRYQSALELHTDLRRVRRDIESGHAAASSSDEIQPELSDVTGTAPIAVATSGSARIADPVSGSGSVARLRVGSEIIEVPSGSEVIYVERKRSRPTVWILAALLVVTVAALGWLMLRDRQPTGVTEGDTLLLTDLVNSTGDPVFDGTLKQALAVKLEESPYLTLFPERQVQDTLRLMERAVDEKVTADIGQEICERQAIKAIVTGEVAMLGSNYVVTLNALECLTGQSLAREQVEASSKEEVLSAVGSAAVKMRKGLGESLASIEKFDAPIEQATTSSLEALKALATGDRIRLEGTEELAIPHYKRALELDSDFALAHARLGTAYANLREWDNAILHKSRAFALRERVSERERLYITGHYHDTVTGDLSKEIEAYEQFKRAYPRETIALNNLCSGFNDVGWFEKAAAECEKAMALNPADPLHYSNLANSYRSLGRLTESQEVLDRAFARGFLRTSLYNERFLNFYLQGNEQGMAETAEAVRGRPGESEILSYQAQAMAAAGQMEEARRFNRQAIDAARIHGFEERTSFLLARQARWEAAFGNFDLAVERAEEALATARTRDSVPIAALALALSGQSEEAQTLLEELGERFPEDTIIHSVWIPLSNAAIALRSEDWDTMIDELELATAYEGHHLLVLYLRGLAFLRTGRVDEARNQYEKLLQLKGVDPTDPVHTLAHLGMGRSLAAMKNLDAARQQYETFLDRLRNSDDGLPLVEAARDEYPALE